MVKENFGLIPKTAVGQVIMHVQHAERIHRPHEAGIDELISFSVVSQPSVEVEPTCSDDVMITPELYRRTLRAPDSGTELAAWKHLAGFLTQEPRVVFEQLAEVLVRACHADSAGATLEERRDSSGNLQWVSAAGQLAPRHRHRVSGHSPSGAVIASQRAELFCRPDRFYASLRHDMPRFEELLVVPWQLGSGRRGAVWIASHSPGRHFDSEDLRMIESLARFANVGMQRSQSEESRRSHEAYASAARVANELAHEINNPLQALINSLHLVSLSEKDEHLTQARVQAMRLARLVQGVLDVKRLDEPT